MSTRRGFPEPLPPEKGHGGAFRTVPWERYPHPRGKNGSPDKPGGLSIQLCKSEKKEFYIRYSS